MTSHLSDVSTIPRYHLIQNLVWGFAIGTQHRNKYWTNMEIPIKVTRRLLRIRGKGGRESRVSRNQIEVGSEAAAAARRVSLLSELLRGEGYTGP